MKEKRDLRIVVWLQANCVLFVMRSRWGPTLATQWQPPTSTTMGEWTDGDTNSQTIAKKQQQQHKWLKGDKMGSMWLWRDTASEREREKMWNEKERASERRGQWNRGEQRDFSHFPTLVQSLSHENPSSLYSYKILILIIVPLCVKFCFVHFHFLSPARVLASAPENDLNFIFPPPSSNLVHCPVSNCHWVTVFSVVLACMYFDLIFLIDFVFMKNRWWKQWKSLVRSKSSCLLFLFLSLSPSSFFVSLPPLIVSSVWMTWWWEPLCSCAGGPTGVWRSWVRCTSTSRRALWCWSPASPTWVAPSPSAGLAALWPHWAI